MHKRKRFLERAPETHSHTKAPTTFKVLEWGVERVEETRPTRRHVWTTHTPSPLSHSLSSTFHLSYGATSTPHPQRYTLADSRHCLNVVTATITITLRFSAIHISLTGNGNFLLSSLHMTTFLAQQPPLVASATHSPFPSLILLSLLRSPLLSRLSRVCSS